MASNEHIANALKLRTFPRPTIAMNLTGDDGTFAFIQVYPQHVPEIVEALLNAYEQHMDGGMGNG